MVQDDAFETLAPEHGLYKGGKADVAVTEGGRYGACELDAVGDERAGLDVGCVVGCVG